MHRQVHLLQGLQLAFLALLFAFLPAASGPVFPTEVNERVRRYSRVYEFDYFDWTLDALGSKLAQAAIDAPFYFPEDQRQKLVTDYLALVDQVLRSESELNLIYTDPAILDPGAASAPLRLALADLETRRGQLAPFAETILESQVSAILASLGLAPGGQPLPPVLFHISPLPFHLVISPRDRIQQDAAISLLPDLSVDQQVSLEEKVSSHLGVSALVVPVGGIGSYPTMVMRTTSLQWLADTISHEWIHNWLTLRPLGMNYGTSPELRTMNETTSSIAGTEIAALLIQRHYPSLLASSKLQLLGTALGPVPPGGWPRPAFDFRQEMHLTRIQVDALLAEGRIEQAEAYMESRRQFFWENGYPIRKLNQAYFAFYGAYADVPGGAAGEDPVGPAVRLLRQQSDSLTDFLETIAAMSSFTELQEAVSP